MKIFGDDLAELRRLAAEVGEVRERISREVDLPQGYHVAFAGQFEQLERAERRLMLVPTALLLVVFLLYSSMGSVRDALIIFTAAPFATLAEVVALPVRSMPFTVSAGVGFGRCRG